MMQSNIQMRSVDYLDVSVPNIEIPIRPGRDIAV